MTGKDASNLSVVNIETHKKVELFDDFKEPISHFCKSSDTLYVGTITNGVIYAYSLESGGKPIQELKVCQEGISSFQIYKEKMFVITNAGYLHMLDVATGDNICSVNLPCATNDFVIDNDTIYLVDRSKNLMRIKIEGL